MINLIHAGLDGLEGVQTFGNMPGDRHAKPMSLGSNHFQSFQFYIVSNFDLFVACILIMLHGRARFCGRIDLNIECMKLVFAIDIAGQEHSRTEPLSLLRGITQRGAKLDVITNVACGRNACGEIRRTKLDLVKMRMHVPKTGQKEFSAGVYDRCRSRNFDLRARPGGNYAIALNHHGGICDRRSSSHIDQSAAD